MPRRIGSPRLLAISSPAAYPGRPRRPRARGRPSSKPLLGQQHRGLASSSMNAEALPRVGRVERDVGAARLEDAEQPDHQLQRALHADARPGPRGPRRAARRWWASWLARRLSSPVGEPLLLEHDRDRVGACARPAPRRARCRHSIRGYSVAWRSTRPAAVALGLASAAAARRGALGLGHEASSRTWKCPSHARDRVAARTGRCCSRASGEPSGRLGERRA